MPVPVESPAAGEPAWELECFARERREFLACLLAACVIYPAYYLADIWTEPQLAELFGVLRALGTLILVIGAVAVHRARTLAQARAAIAITLAVSGAIIAAMLPRVGHYSIYLVGYSAYFWGTFLLSWPVWLAITVYGWHLASVATAFVLTPSDRTPADYLFAALLLTSAAVLTTLSGYARRTAHAREFQISSALSQRNLDLAGALADLRDTQARLVAQEKLSALGRMLAGLSHEMSNPVNVLLNNLEPVREHFDAFRQIVEQARAGAIGDPPALAAACEAHEIDWRKDDLHDALLGMEQAAQRVCQVHSDLRAFIRGDVPGITRVDVRDGLRATLALVSRKVPERVQLTVELEETPELDCHPGQLNQVWLNLIQNAIDAVGSTGVVEVQARTVEGRIEIAVADDGPGVDQVFRPRLFEPFATTKSVGCGTGLGLATSYQIVQSHGGRLYLDETHSPGARFVVELPLSGPVH